MGQRVNNGTDAVGEFMLADPRTLLADADAEDVPAEERARRERARVKAAAASSRTASTTRAARCCSRSTASCLSASSARTASPPKRAGWSSRSTMTASGSTPRRSSIRASARTVRAWRMRPARRFVVAETATGRAHAVFTVAEQDARHDARRSGGIRRCRGDGPPQRFLVGPRFAHTARGMLRLRRRTVCGRSATRRTRPTWACATATPRALTQNAVVDLFAVHLADDRLHVDRTALVDWDNTVYEYLAVWCAGRPVSARCCAC